MVKYTFVGKNPKRSQHDEIEKYLRDKEFIKVLRLAGEYYIQGYEGDYGFKVIPDTKFFKVTIKIY